MADRLEVPRDIAASPGQVYAAISDVTRMVEWSEECDACEWHEGFDGRVVGATFDGHNRHGEHEWTTQGEVVEADPGHAFAFECSMMDFDDEPDDRASRGDLRALIAPGPRVRGRHRREPRPAGCPHPSGGDARSGGGATALTPRFVTAVSATGRAWQASRTTFPL